MGGRVSLIADNFGIHTVDTYGSHCTDDTVITVPEVESHFNYKMFRGEGSFTVFDAFMDYNLGFWFMGDLNWLAKSLDEMGTKYFVLSWNTTAGAEYYSVITYIPGTQ